MDTNKYLKEKFKVAEDALPPYAGSPDGTTRKDIYTAFVELGFKIGAEIGVFRGRNALRIFEQVPGAKLIGVDPWVFYTGINKGMPPLSRNFERDFQVAQERLKKYDMVWMRKSSIEGSKLVDDNSLDFVYIDAAHDFNNVIMDLIHWSPKVRSGGIISGHDYSPVNGVIKAVNAYTYAHGIKDVHITREPLASFFWAKP